MKSNGLFMGSLFICSMLFISSFFVGAVSISKENDTVFASASSISHDANLPQWNIGDSWTYRIQVEGNQNEYFDLDFDLIFDSITFEVVEVLDDLYRLSIDVPEGDLSGAVTVDLGVFAFSGALENAYLDGFIYVNKSDLCVFRVEGGLGGETNKIILPRFDIDFNLEFEIEKNNEGFKTDLPLLSFPMDVDDLWMVPLTFINITMDAHQPNLGENRLFSFVLDHQRKCEGWDVVELDDREIDALRISGVEVGDGNDIYFSPAVGNIVRVVYENVAMGYGYRIQSLIIDLLSTSYEPESDPPDIPDMPVGGTSFVAGETSEYETSSIDPEDDKIRYIFDWGDGSGFSYSDFIGSGETCVVSHSWTAKGEHELRVKARDTFGQESDWSESLLVTVVNNNPGKPLKPDGPTDGKIKIDYTYATSCTDPDGHQVQYGFDWDGDDTVDTWTEFYDSGMTVSEDHRWNTKGEYEIKVKARDEYGEESVWSDILQITMPKNRFFDLFLLDILKQFSIPSFLLH